MYIWFHYSQNINDNSDKSKNEWSIKDNIKWIIHRKGWGGSKNSDSAIGAEGRIKMDMIYSEIYIDLVAVSNSVVLSFYPVQRRVRACGENGDVNINSE